MTNPTLAAVPSPETHTLADKAMSKLLNKTVTALRDLAQEQVNGDWNFTYFWFMRCLNADTKRTGAAFCAEARTQEADIETPEVLAVRLVRAAEHVDGRLGSYSRTNHIPFKKVRARFVAKLKDYACPAWYFDEDMLRYFDEEVGS